MFLSGLLERQFGEHVDCGDFGLGQPGRAPESVCTPGQGWVVLGSDTRSGTRGVFPFSACLC